MQANCVAFYRQFLESPNFMCWFERQRKAAWDWQVVALTFCCRLCQEQQ